MTITRPSSVRNSETIHHSSEPATGTSLTGPTDKQWQSAHSSTNKHGINNDKIVGADRASTIGTLHSPETLHLRPLQAKPRFKAAPILPDVRDVRQIAEATCTATTVTFRAHHLQDRRTRKTKWPPLLGEYPQCKAAPP